MTRRSTTVSSATAPGADLVSLQIRTTIAFSELVEIGLGAISQPFSLFLDDTAQTAQFDIFLESELDASRLRLSLEDRLRQWSEGETWSISIKLVPFEDWGESWKQHFPAERVSARIVVRPTWATFQLGQNDLEVQIDPGMSFGTGRHFTTRSCLKLVDVLAGHCLPSSLLDLGTGTGILAIAAVRLGFSPVVAVDNDPQAVQIARANAALNSVAGKISFSVGDLASMRNLQPCSVVVANILADVLTAQAGNIVECVDMRPGSHLILAGMLADQYPLIRDQYQHLGFGEMAVESGDGWTTGLFQRL